MCSPTWDEHASYASVVTIIGLLTPLGFMIFSYARVIQVARKQARRIADIQMCVAQGSEKPRIAVIGDEATDDKQGCPAAKTREDKPRSSVKKRNTLRQNLKTLKTVFIVIGTFFICWAPYVFLNLWAVNNDSKTVPYAADFLTTLLAFSNSSVNPYIFALLNRDFRNAWKDIFMMVRGSRFRPRRDSFLRLQSELRGSKITIMEFSQRDSGSEIISVASFSRHRNDSVDVREAEVVCTVKISSTVEARTKGGISDTNNVAGTKNCDDIHIPGQVD
ncbi:D(1A) dopamine receptor-like [Lineus longissimus]|uniref:D(1A) dopamine receptor-like n=1 Tax=Lineus longissimus TaxID=88925 RepID=UPI00315C61B0